MPALARAQSPQEIKPCAKDPTYRFLEAYQQDAYESSPISFEILQEDRARVLKPAAETLKRDARRPNTLGVPSLIDAEGAKRLDSAVKRIKVPTCFEDPVIYYMIQGNVQAIERARKALHLNLTHPPKYGSLPTSEVNAKTYFDADTGERIIGFNNELFRFADVLTQLSVATIPVENLSNLEKVAAATPTEIMTEFFVHPEWQTNAIAAVLGFLHVPAPSLLAFLGEYDKSYDQFVIPLVGGMDTFVVGHEYGHVIRGHQPGIRQTPAAANAGNASPEAIAPVASWTWQQELEADGIGVELTAQAMRIEAKRNYPASAQWLYALRGALLFMKCLEIIDEAEFIKDHNDIPPEPTVEQRSLMRKFADGGLLSADEIKAVGSTFQNDHPPAWLRSERMEKQIERIIQQSSATAEARVNDRIADAIVTNISVFWAMSKRDFQKRIARPAGR